MTNVTDLTNWGKKRSGPTQPLDQLMIGGWMQIFLCFFFHPCVNHPYFDGHPFILQLGMVYYICVMLVKQCRKPSPILALLGGIETYWNRIKHDKTMIKPRFYHKLPRLWRVPLVQKGVQQTLATVADIFSQPWGLVVWELTTRPVKRTKSYWKWP